MAKQDDAKVQEERARRLREQIERLKSGKPDKPPGKPKSIREQVDDAARKKR